MKYSTNIVKWQQVWSIAGVQGAISVSWLIYRLYLPNFFADFNFSASVVMTIFIIENGLSFFTEPLFGWYSDRLSIDRLSRLPIIILGVVLSAILLISLPILIIFNGFNWLLPILAVLWALTMTMFRSPMMALLAQIATISQLPQTVSILIVVSGLISAFRPLITPILLDLGALFCFSLASFSLVASAIYLRFLFVPLQTKITSIEPLKVSLINLTFLGAFFAIVIRIIFMYLSNFSNDKNINILLLILLAIMALPVGKIASYFNPSTALLIGIIVNFMAIISFNFPVLSTQITGVILTLFGLNFIFNGVIPYSIYRAKNSQFGWAIGLYFGGFNLGMGLFDFWLANLSSEVMIYTAIACLIGAGLLLIRKF